MNFDFSRRRFEPFEPQGETVPIGAVLGAGRQMDRSPVQLLQRFEHRAVTLTKQAPRIMAHDNDDIFTPKLGRIRSLGGTRAKTYVVRLSLETSWQHVNRGLAIAGIVVSYA